MNETIDIRSAIRRRISVRHYKERPVPDNILEDVIISGEKSVALDGSIRVRFHLFKEGRLVTNRMARLTGTRLLFGSAPHFIVATSEDKPLFMVNMGFRMEQMILRATQKGLGTCWIGGMFTEERIRSLMSLEKSERIVALTPIGYPDTSWLGRATHDVIELGAMKQGRRKALREIAFGATWETPLQSDDSELLEALECARLAPSWANTQPWRFLVWQRKVIAVANTKGKYGNVRQGKRYYRLDVGIAMAHFFLVAREMGWSGSWYVTGFDGTRIAIEHAIPEGYEVLGIYERHSYTT
jgi:nitroreductase